MMASTVRFDRYEYRIDRRKSFGIIKLEDPPFLARIVFIKDPDAECLLVICAAPPPRPERAAAFQSCFLVQVTGVENGRLSLV